MSEHRQKEHGAKCSNTEHPLTWLTPVTTAIYQLQRSPHCSSDTNDQDTISPLHAELQVASFHR